MRLHAQSTLEYALLLVLLALLLLLTAYSLGDLLLGWFTRLSSSITNTGT